MTQIERITYYETILNEAEDALELLGDALETYRALQGRIRELDDYYGSDEWRQDLEDDEAGKLPADLPRGVLSEDGIWDLLTDERELAALMSEYAAEFIRQGTSA